ncbi:Putative pre-mRNA-splicing factor ATP-dependent RNA helicase dhx15 [Aduncisulcus paluster]|uniref:Pre-mRNA-splicing factor ATP-dependent RNA helicase dhx15 n=1 Tax=Aduncisulcus paluster TaxID=2918883 RepID=A0ABQ5KYE1_9EUKA|nr:Putative pre-mRNA-splicing factor ATP-dependent RNA helicase dhx15 [Aduncisulcus paluster]
MDPDTILPIQKVKKEIMKDIIENDCLIVVGETGSGKSTQLPQFIKQLGLIQPSQSLIVSQPRRVAAMSLADRVANEMHVSLGREVGYAVRFDEKKSKDTYITFMTDGMLLRELLKDPLLSKYNVIMIDEAHERTLHTDVCVALVRAIYILRSVKRAIPHLPPLKLLITSATIDSEKYSKYFFNSKVISVSGRMYPITTVYTKDPLPSYVSGAVRACFQIHQSQPVEKGDILVFLTGEEEINAAVSDIRSLNSQFKKASIEKKAQMMIELERREERARHSHNHRKKSDSQSHDSPQSISSRPLKTHSSIDRSSSEGIPFICVSDLVPLPLYSSLPPDEQALVFKSHSSVERRVIFSTNIAETSLTIPNIGFVIDCGLVKQRQYDSKTGVDTLSIVPISQHSAKQRAGRAGRVQEGMCMCLYTEDSFFSLPEFTTPEIERTPLSDVLLLLRSMRISERELVFIDPLPASAVKHALEELRKIGAINPYGEVTPIGRIMSLFPLPPHLSRVLVCSIWLIVNVWKKMEMQRQQQFSSLETESAVKHALEELRKIGAINPYGEVTPIGRIMSLFPLPPHLSRVLVCSIWLIVNVWKKMEMQRQQQFSSLETESSLDSATIVEIKELISKERYHVIRKESSLFHTFVPSNSKFPLPCSLMMDVLRFDPLRDVCLVIGVLSGMGGIFLSNVPLSYRLMWAREEGDFFSILLLLEDYLKNSKNRIDARIFVSQNKLNGKSIAYALRSAEQLYRICFREVLKCWEKDEFIDILPPQVHTKNVIELERLCTLLVKKQIDLARKCITQPHDSLNSHVEFMKKYHPVVEPIRDYFLKIGMLSGLCTRVARRIEGSKRYKIVGSSNFVRIHPHSFTASISQGIQKELKDRGGIEDEKIASAHVQSLPKVIMFNEVIFTSNFFCRYAAPILWEDAREQDKL